MSVSEKVRARATTASSQSDFGLAFLLTEIGCASIAAAFAFDAKVEGSGFCKLVGRGHFKDRAGIIGLGRGFAKALEEEPEAGAV